MFIVFSALHFDLRGHTFAMNTEEESVFGIILCLFKRLKEFPLLPLLLCNNWNYLLRINAKNRFLLQTKRLLFGLFNGKMSEGIP